MLEILVYGAEERCASCVNAPSSKETASWLEAALQREYKPEYFRVRYVDIYQPNTQEEKDFSLRVLDEDLWYPVVVMNGEIVTEGNPMIKVVYEKLDKLGIPKL